MDQFEKKHQRWEIRKVEEVAAPDGVAIGPFGSDMKTDSYVDSGIPVIRGSNVDSGRHFVGEFVYISEEKADELSSSNVFPGDLVFPHRGSIGEVGVVPPAPPERWMLSTSLMKFTPDESKILPEFAYYYFRTEYGRQELLKNASTVGTPGIGTPLKSLRNIRIPVPPLHVQRRIADILGAFDDKIELNRRMNETLEEMAQALYRHWFVDFGPFQDREFKDTKELGPIPKGWDTAPLDEVASFLNGTQWSRYKPESDDEETLQVIKIKELRNGFSEKSDEVSKEDIPNKYIIEDGDIIFSWSGSLLLRIWSDGQGALNQHLFKVSSEHFPKWFYYQGVRHHIDRFRRIAESKATTMGHIKRSHLSESHVPVPPKGIMKEAHQQIHPLMQHQISNLLESKKLAETRDYLLPKLISGEIEVDAAREVAEDTVDAPA